MNDELDDIFNIAVEDSIEDITVDAEGFEEALCNRKLTFLFNITNATADGMVTIKPDSVKRHHTVIEIENIIKKYISYRGILSASNISKVSFYKDTVKRSWMEKCYFVLDIYWNGNFLLTSREIIHSIRDIIKLVFDRTKCTVSKIAAFTITNSKLHSIASTPEISKSYDMYTAMLKIIDGGEYFSETFALNDAVDGLYDIVCRMLREENRLCEESMRWMLNRTKKILKKTPLYNVINTNVMSAIYQMKGMKSVEIEDTDNDMRRFIYDMRSDEERTLYICPARREKKQMQTIDISRFDDLLPRVESIETSVGTIRKVCEMNEEQIMKLLFANHVTELSILGHLSMHGKYEFVDIYSMSPLFSDNEMYWVAIKENRPNHDRVYR